MRLIDETNNLVKLEEGELPQLRGRGVATSLNEAAINGNSVVYTAKGRKEPEEYTTKLIPVDPAAGIYQVVAADKLKTYARSGLAASWNPAVLTSDIRMKRMTNAILSQQVGEEAGMIYDIDRDAINYGKNNIRGKETHHINGVKTQADVLVSLPTPDDQVAYAKGLLDRNLYLSDHIKNQVGLYGNSVKNVPGYRHADITLTPDEHPGHHQHSKVHKNIEQLSDEFGLPRNEQILNRMALMQGVEEQKALGYALAEVGRLAVMQELASNAKAEHRQRMRIAHELSKTVDPRISAMPTREGLMRVKGTPLPKFNG